MTHINSIEAFINPRVITFIDCGMALKKYTSEKNIYIYKWDAKGFQKVQLSAWISFILC